MNSRAVKDKCFSEMARFIESQIAAGLYRPGDRLPPLRHWCGEFRLDLNAARRAMWALRDRGLVECRRGAGVYVRDFGTSSGERTRVALVYSNIDPTQSYCAHAMLGIRQAGRKRVDFELFQISFSWRYDAFAPMPELNDFQSVILLGNYDRIEVDYSWLRRPAVGVEMHWMYGGLFSVVTMDPVNAAVLATDYFLKHGKKHVTVLDNMTTPLHRFRAQVFRDVFEDAGGTAEIVRSCLKIPDDFSDRDRGYLCTSGMVFEHQAALFPGDLAHERCVVSLDAKSEILPGYTPVTTIGPDWRQIGVLALEEAVRRGKHPGSMGKRIYADVRLIER